MAWTHFPHGSAQKNNNKKCSKFQRLFLKGVISEIIFVKVYSLEKNTNPCVNLPSLYVVPKNAYFIIFDSFSVLQHDTDGSFITGSLILF